MSRQHLLGTQQRLPLITARWLRRPLRAIIILSRVTASVFVAFVASGERLRVFVTKEDVVLGHQDKVEDEGQQSEATDGVLHKANEVIRVR